KRQRGVSPAARRRRALAVLLLIAATALVFTLRSAHRADRHGATRPSATKSSSTPKSSGIAVIISAEDAGWHLPSGLSRAVAFADGNGVLIAGGLRGDQTT